MLTVDVANKVLYFIVQRAGVDQDSEPCAFSFKKFRSRLRRIMFSLL